MENTNTISAIAVEPHAQPHGVLENDVKPTGARAQNATDLALSGQPDYDIVASVNRIAKGKIKQQGLVTERFNLNAQKLVNSVVADYRAHHAAMYNRNSRLPSDIYEKIEDAVGEWIVNKLAKVLTPSNTVKTSTSFRFRKPKLGDALEEQWVKHIEATGEEIPHLKEQRFACNIEIGRIERRLKDLRNKPNPDLDLEKRYEEKLLRQQRELSYLEGEMKRQGELVG